MVHRLVVSYGQPEDPTAFDANRRDTHTITHYELTEVHTAR